ncbi:MAG: HAD family hydrolase [Pseudomonadota bacterium]
MRRWTARLLALTVVLGVLAVDAEVRADPLPSWNETTSKAQILSFIDQVTDPASPDYVTPAERIAVFDNDGTLWGEKPFYFQLFFAVDKLKELAEQDPAIVNSPAREAAIAGDFEALFAGGEEALLDVIFASHADISVDDFTADVREWLATARHPVTGRRYDGMVYQPMLELLSALRDNGFSTWIVSGGGIHFIRAFADDVYGIPPEQVIGSTVKTVYEVVDGVPVIMKTPAIGFIDDKAGKPVAIDAHIGRRPIFAGGNSDGDFEMLEYVTSGEGPRFGLLIHHTDAARESAYDRDSSVGRLDRGLDEAGERGWLVVDMAEDWAAIYPGP